jgi:hypothetical protein
VLGTYAPDLEGEGHAGAHAASHAAVGFSGLVRLAEATDRNPQILRSEHAWDTDDLVVATPEDAATALGKILGARGTSKPTLFVLPKWNVQGDNSHKGWIRVKGLMPTFEPEGVFAPALEFDIKRHLDKKPALQVTDDSMPASIRFATPAKLQVIERPAKPSKDDEDAAPVIVTSAQDEDADQSDDDETFEHTYDDIQPLITDGSGGIVLGEIDNMFILADPDLIDNAGMKDERNASSALALLDWLKPAKSEEIDFDVVLNGLGESKSLLRLAFDPPFLAMTLTLAAMVLLLGIRAAGRFGAPRPRQRAIAFGKAALVDNGAMLVSKAGKARLLGGRYAEAIREQAVRAFAVSPRLAPADVDQYLDGLGRGDRFTELVHRADAARDDHDMLAAAQALHTWKQEIVRDD